MLVHGSRHQTRDPSQLLDGGEHRGLLGMVMVLHGLSPGLDVEEEVFDVLGVVVCLR